MEPRNYIGIAMIILGLALQPVGWMYSVAAHVMSFIMIILGVMIFASQKYLDHITEKENQRYGSGTRLPGDTEGHSGWDGSGKTTAQEYSSGFDGGGE